jgi:hypothetical protein
MQQATQVAGQAAAAAAPIARAAGGAAWQASKKGMSWFAKLVTLGGRAAYTEVFNPPSIVEGQVVGLSPQANTPAPIEPSAFVFALSFLIWPLVFLVKDWPTQLAILAGVTVLLLALNFAGLRWPAFTRLTFGRLFGRYPQGAVPEMRFQVNDGQKGIVNVRVVGGRRETVLLAVSHLVRVYGMPEPGRNEVRAWKIEVYAASGQPLGITTAPRTLPLFAMLFTPTVLLFVVWLIIQITQLVK